MKYIRLIPLILLALVNSATMSAYDFSAKNAEGVTLYYNIISNGSCEVTYTVSNSHINKDNYDYKGAIVIPSSVEHNGTPYSVTSIGGSAFSDCSSLVSVEIPNSITSIGGSAFSDCSSLVSVEIPNSITSIGNSAFYQCI